MDSPSSEVKILSECFVLPKTIPEKWKEPYHLSQLDLEMLSMHYIQLGLVFLKPSSLSGDSIRSKYFMETWLQKLKDSLAATLVHFYPFAGRLSTSKTDNPSSYSVFVDCNNSPGAGFIYAKLDLSVKDVIGPKYVPLVVQSLFDHHKAVSHDGHTLSLLSIKVTELIDGVFIGLSLNHLMGDGSSVWQFLNSLSEIFNAQETENLLLKNPPIFERWLPKGVDGPVHNLPFTHPDEFISRSEPPVLKDRIFHFSSETISSLTAKANQECGTTMISSFESLTSFIWRCINRARKLPYGHETPCSSAANSRTKMDPLLSLDYFRNCIASIRSITVKSGKVLENDFGWECEFGMGKAVAVRSGYGGKFDGKVSANAGREGGGSIDLEVCLIPEFMEALESDQEFMSLVSSSSS